MSTQFSYCGNRANKENHNVDEVETQITSVRGNKENIPPNDISRPGRVFGQELGNIQKKNMKGAIENKQNPILRKSLTMDIKLQNNTNNVKSGVLLERPLLGDMNLNIINEADDNTNLNGNKSSLGYQAMDIELDSEMDKYDLENMHNPQVVGTVAKDIFKYLKNIETEYLAKQDYMASQSDINEKMRAILIDWLVDVNVKFKLVPEC